MRQLVGSAAVLLTVFAAGGTAAAQDSEIGPSGLGIAAGAPTALFRDGLPDIGSRNLVLTDRGLAFSVGRTEQEVSVGIDQGNLAVRLTQPDSEADRALRLTAANGGRPMPSDGADPLRTASPSPGDGPNAQASSAVADTLGSLGTPTARTRSVVDAWTMQLDTLPEAR